MKKYILQGKKDAIKCNLVLAYEMAKTYQYDRTEHHNKITGEKTIETSQLLPDGRVLVEITKL